MKAGGPAMRRGKCPPQPFEVHGAKPTLVDIQVSRAGCKCLGLSSKDCVSLVLSRYPVQGPEGGCTPQV